MAKMAKMAVSELLDSPKRILRTYLKDIQCGNFIIFPSFRFYVKSILENLEALKLQFLGL